MRSVYGSAGFLSSNKLKKKHIQGIESLSFCSLNQTFDAVFVVEDVIVS